MAGSNRRQLLGGLATGLVSGTATTVLNADTVKQESRRGGRSSEKDSCLILPFIGAHDFGGR